MLALVWNTAKGRLMLSKNGNEIELRALWFLIAGGKGEVPTSWMTSANDSHIFAPKPCRVKKNRQFYMGHASR